MFGDAYRGGSQWIGLSNQPPDFANSLAKVMQIKAMQQQGEAATVEAEGRNRLMALLQRPGFVASLSENSPAALAELGAVGPAGLNLALPRLDQMRQDREFRDLLGGNGPVPAQGGPPVGGTAPGYATRVAALESPTGAPNAESGATGPYQIMPATRAAYPPGTPDDVILASETAQNARALQQGLGRAPTEAETFLAHRLGAGGALAVLRADPNAPLQDVLAPVFDGSSPGRPPLQAVLAQNPYLVRAGTAGGLVQQINAAWEQQGRAAPGASRGTMPGVPSPELFARAVQMAAGGNPAAQRFVQAWAPFMRADSNNLPLSPEVEAQRIRIAQASRPQTNVNLPANESAVIKADADTLKQMNEGAQQARAVVALMDQAERAVRRVPEGAGAQLVPIIGQIGKRLGFDIEGSTESEVLRGLTTTLATLQRVPSSGATTDFEMRLYMNAAPRLGNTREGNLQLIEIGRALARRKIEEAGVFRRNLGQPDLQDKLDALGPVLTEQQRAWLESGIAEVQGPNVPGAITTPGPGGQGTAAPPPPPASGSGGGWSIRPLR